jgi:hypothetical protein
MFFEYKGVLVTAVPQGVASGRRRKASSAAVAAVIVSDGLLRPISREGAGSVLFSDVLYDLYRPRPTQSTVPFQPHKAKTNGVNIVCTARAYGCCGGYRGSHRDYYEYRDDFEEESCRRHRKTDRHPRL